MKQISLRRIPLFLSLALFLVIPGSASFASEEGIPAPPDVGAVPDDAEKAASGLAWKVLQEGTGDEHPAADARVTVHYTGWTTDGDMFDSSVQRGKPSPPAC